MYSGCFKTTNLPFDICVHFHFSVKELDPHPAPDNLQGPPTCSPEVPRTQWQDQAYNDRDSLPWPMNLLHPEKLKQEIYIWETAL